jgi:imidazolonepropionase-like amidohydrolase
MSVLPAERAATDGEGNDTQQARAPTLISEQEVAFSTSAAASLPHTATQGSRDATRTVVATVRRMFVTATANSRPVRRDFQSRRMYIERARMSREMDRL